MRRPAWAWEGNIIMGVVFRSDAPTSRTVQGSLNDFLNQFIRKAGLASVPVKTWRRARLLAVRIYCFHGGAS